MDDLITAFCGRLAVCTKYNHHPDLPIPDFVVGILLYYCQGRLFSHLQPPILVHRGMLYLFELNWTYHTPFVRHNCYCQTTLDVDLWYIYKPAFFIVNRLEFLVTLLPGSPPRSILNQRSKHRWRRSRKRRDVFWFRQCCKGLDHCQSGTHHSKLYTKSHYQGSWISQRCSSTP